MTTGKPKDYPEWLVGASSPSTFQILREVADSGGPDAEIAQTLLAKAHDVVRESIAEVAADLKRRLES